MIIYRWHDMILNNVNELYLIEYLETLSMIDIYD